MRDYLLVWPLADLMVEKEEDDKDEEEEEEEEETERDDIYFRIYVLLCPANCKTLCV